MSSSILSPARGAAVGARVLVAAVVLPPGAAVAQGVLEAEPTVERFEEPGPFGFERVRQSLGTWGVMLGAAATLQPVYEGSDEFEVLPIPFASATFYDRVTVDPTGITATLFEPGPFRFALKGGYEVGRDEDASRDLRGMGNVDMGGTIGGRISAAFGMFEVYADVTKTLGGSDGLTGVAGVEATVAVNEWLRLGAGASATLADENHMRAYFGVDRRQARRSGYARYAPDAGLKRLDLTASATVGITENWFVRSEAGVGFLVGDAADSPIVRNEVQPSAMLIVGYRF